jgi:hypothetical protein
MDEGLVPLLRNLRIRLNAAIVAHRALAWAAPSALAAGALVAALRALGLDAVGIPLWAGLTALGAAAGAARSRLARMDEAGAALWLDERLEDEELFSAALDCLDRGGQGPFDGAILEKAAGLVPRARSVRVPRGPLAKKAIISAAACAIGLYLVFLSSPIAGPSIARARRTAEAAASSAGDAAKAASALEEGGKAAADFASSLFPDNKRMATLAERALREGRIDDLRDMLKAAGLELESKMARAISESERKKLARENERLQAAAAAMAMGMGARAPGSGKGESGSPGRGGSAQDGSANSGKFAPDSENPYGSAQGGGSRGGPGTRREGPNSGSGQGGGAGADGALDGGDSGAIDGGAAGRGGKGYGSGSGAEGDWGRVEGASGAEKAVIAPSKDASFFELVLPGHDASEPLSRIAPDSRKSAEAAMAREGVPLDYEEYVRSYFMALSQGPRP